MIRFTPSTTATRRAFTLVELLVAIAIIGILMSIAIPAVMRSISTARATTIRMEVSALEQAIEKYLQEYGDYPPDFSSLQVVQKHYRKLFPRMSAADSALLTNLLSTLGTFDPTRMDRAEALVWTLGGYSKNKQRPFSGDGGPLAWIGTVPYTDSSLTDADRANPDNFQINVDRVNALYDFAIQRLNYSSVNSSAPFSATNRYVSTDDTDLFPTYAARDGGAPFVYFDSRTYDLHDPTRGFNGYGNAAFGAVRPYLSDKSKANTTGADYATLVAALQGWQFMNPDSFQIISAGLDNNFGSIVGPSSAPRQIFFQYPQGTAIEPSTSVDTPGELAVANVRGFQESSAFGVVENFHLDNITNFSTSQLVDDVPAQ
jgi:prepilin-type N-terminal cleavage/methylation domain-containing protein